MTFTVNVFLFLAFYIVTPVPAVIELFASTVDRFLSWVIFAFIRFPTGRLSYNYCSFVFKMSLGQHRSVFRLL